MPTSETPKPRTGRLPLLLLPGLVSVCLADADEACRGRGGERFGCGIAGAREQQSHRLAGARQAKLGWRHRLGRQGRNDDCSSPRCETPNIDSIAARCIHAAEPVYQLQPPRPT